MRNNLLLFIGFFVVASPSYAEFFVGEGATGSAFLKIPISARATALGGSFTGVAGDVSALEYNPAGLFMASRQDISATYINSLEDTSLQSLAFLLPPVKALEQTPRFLEKFYFGAQYRVLNTDNEQRDSIGFRQGEFNVRDQLFHVAVAYPLSSSLATGFSAKIINSKIQSESVTNFAGDVGLLWAPRVNWTMGASLLNVGPDTKFVDEGDPLPTTLRVGTGYHTGKFLLVSDLAYGRDEISRISGGVEYTPLPMVALRGGLYHNSSNIEFTGGLGIRLNPNRSLGARKSNPSSEWQKITTQPKPLFSRDFEIGLDYAIETQNELGMNHRVTLRFKF